MLRKHFLLYSCFCLSITGFSQQFNSAIISPAGDAGKTASLYLEWTLGEPMIESVSVEHRLYTQGFHQPTVPAKRFPAIAAAEQEWFQVSLLPNPVQSLLQATFTRETTSPLLLVLSDINGRPVIVKTSSAKTDAIEFNLAPASSGVYLLTIRNASGTIHKTFKIVKAL